MRNQAGILALVILVVPLLGMVGCDKGTPVAPVGAVLAIFASPTQIDVDGQSTITVSATRGNGVPVNPGTEIFLSTSLGTIPEIVTTDDRGLARTVLQATGRAGMATVTARSGGAEAVTVDVTIGIPANAISLQASPTSIPESGGTIDLLALVRDDQGEPLGGVNVNFKTPVGTLDSGGAFLRSQSDGTVTDTLEVTADELGAFSGSSFMVTVEASGSSGLLTDSVTITIQGAG